MIPGLKNPTSISRKKLPFFFFLGSIFLLALTFFWHFVKPEFKLDSNHFMALCGEGRPIWKSLNKKDLKELEFYDEIYLNRFPPRESIGYKIPKIIHMIWLGSKPLPLETIDNLKTWKKYHQNWTIKFWTDSAECPPLLDGVEKHLVSEISLDHLDSFFNQAQNMGEKSMLLRYEILFQEGGLYVDHDAKCYQSFDKLHRSYDFYSCLEPLNVGKERGQTNVVSSSILGSSPRHPVIGETFRFIHDTWKNIPPNELTIKKIRLRSLYSLTRAVRSNLKNDQTAIVFPSSFFFASMFLSKKEVAFLKSQHLVFAAHGFARSWYDYHLMDKKQLILRQFNKKNKEILKRLESGSLFVSLTSFTGLTLLFLLLYLKKITQTQSIQ